MSSAGLPYSIVRLGNLYLSHNGTGGEYKLRVGALLSLRLPSRSLSIAKPDLRPCWNPWLCWLSALERCSLPPTVGARRPSAPTGQGDQISGILSRADAAAVACACAMGAPHPPVRATNPPHPLPAELAAAQPR